MKAITSGGKPLLSGGRLLTTPGSPCACGDCGGTPTNGACCPEGGGDCYITTLSECVASNGTFQGSGTNCNAVNCTNGACCPPDGGDCYLTSLSGCASANGNFHGNGTNCDGVNCVLTGACCVGTECSIETESDCTDLGGTYQGDDTICDPNPCPPIPSPCCDDHGFVGFIDGSTRFLTRTLNFTYSDASGTGAPCQANWNQTSIYSIDPVTCEALNCIGTGGGTRNNDGEVFHWSWGFVGFLFDCSCIGGPCGPCVNNDCDHGSATTVISNTEKQNTCSFSDPSGFTSSATFTETLSNPCVQSGMSPPP